MYDVPLPCLIAPLGAESYLLEMLLAKETPAEKWSISDLHASCSSAVAAASKEHQGPAGVSSFMVFHGMEGCHGGLITSSSLGGSLPSGSVSSKFPNCIWLGLKIGHLHKGT